MKSRFVAARRRSWRGRHARRGRLAAVARPQPRQPVHRDRPLPHVARGWAEGALEDARGRRVRRRRHQGRPALHQRLRRREEGARGPRAVDGRRQGSVALELRRRHPPQPRDHEDGPVGDRQVRVLARPEVPVPRARREDGEAALAEEPGAGVQGGDSRAGTRGRTRCSTATASSSRRAATRWSSPSTRPRARKSGVPRTPART